MQLESSEGLDSTSTYPKWNLTFHFSEELLLLYNACILFPDMLKLMSEIEKGV